MRASEIAALTGTTVRTVRYYHSLGLLPVPAERGGWRDYELAHVARLSRIRWLVRAGLPLSAVARVLDGASAPASQATPDQPQVAARRSQLDDDAPPPGAATVVADLTAALGAAEEHLAEVTAQRDRLRALLARAEQGCTVSPMPTTMAAFFDRLEQAATDERTRAAVRRERDVVDLACYRGQIPPEAEALFGDLDEQDLQEVLRAYGSQPQELTDEQVLTRVRGNVARLEKQLGARRLTELARSVDEETVRSFFRLTDVLQPFDARLARAMEAALLDAIRRWRSA